MSRRQSATKGRRAPPVGPVAHGQARHAVTAGDVAVVEADSAG